MEEEHVIQEGKSEQGKFACKAAHMKEKSGNRGSLFVKPFTGIYLTLQIK